MGIMEAERIGIWSSGMFPGGGWAPPIFTRKQLHWGLMPRTGASGGGVCVGFMSRGHSGSDRIIRRVDFSVTCGGCRGNLFWHPCFQKSGKGPSIWQTSCWVPPLLLSFWATAWTWERYPSSERPACLRSASSAVVVPVLSYPSLRAHLETCPLPMSPWWEWLGLPQLPGLGRRSPGHAEGAAQALSPSTWLPKLLSILLHPTSWLIREQRIQDVFSGWWWPSSRRHKVETTRVSISW